MQHVGPFIANHGFSSCSMACEIPVPWPELELATPVLQGRLSTTRPPRSPCLNLLPLQDYYNACTLIHSVLSRVWLSATLWTVVCQASLSIGFPRQECWSVLPFPPTGDLPYTGIKPASSALAGRFFTTEPPGKPITMRNLVHSLGHLVCTQVYIKYKLPGSLWKSSD